MRASPPSGPARAAIHAIRPFSAAPRSIRPLVDPYLLYTATLGPIVLLVAILDRQPAAVALSIGLSAAAVLIQYGLGRVAVRPRSRRALIWPIVRILVPLTYVGTCVQLVGGPGLPLLALYIPIVAAAAAIGPVHGWVTAGLATVVYLAPELNDLGSPAGVVLRGVTLAGVAIVLAFGTRHIMAAMERAVRDSRTAAAVERRRRRQIDALDTVGRRLAASGPSVETLEAVLDDIVRHLGYRHASIYLGDEHRVELAAQRGYPDAIGAFDPSFGVAGRVMRSRQIALVSDVASDPDYVPGTIEATSLVSAPLIVDGVFVGLVNVETTGDVRLDRTDRSLIGILAGRLATAVALGRDRQALAARTRLFRGAGDFSQRVTSSLAIQPLSEVIVEGVDDVLETDAVALAILDRTSGGYRVAAVRGSCEEAADRPVTPGSGLLGRAIRDRAVVVEEPADPASSTDVLHDPQGDATSARGLAIPLVRDGVVVGALGVWRTGSSAAFGRLETEGLALLASHAALAIANAFLHADVTELAVRDSLTGLYNRRHFDESLERMLAAHRRDRVGKQRPMSVIMFDLDHFGLFNKAHGHQVGDLVLKAFADVLSGRFRAADLVARIGGEEFIVALDGVGREAAVGIADEVRLEMASRTVLAEDGEKLQVTVSAGCAELDPADPSRATLLRTADVALFMAKRAGRDRVVAA